MSLVELLLKQKPLGTIETPTTLQLYTGPRDSLTIRRTKGITTVLQENIGNGELVNTYIHHNKGPGRKSIKCRTGRGYIDNYGP